jgi:hypothetical protein
MVHVPSSGRMAFLAERRALSVQRFDTVHSPHYDQRWGAISATHADFAATSATPDQSPAALRHPGCDSPGWPAYRMRLSPGRDSVSGQLQRFSTPQARGWAGP